LQPTVIIPFGSEGEFGPIPTHLSRCVTLVGTN
jgi:hypothetical protein